MRIGNRGIDDASGLKIEAEPRELRARNGLR
jgi:hypothetical protein